MFLLMNLIRATDLFNDVGEYFTKLGSLAYQFNFHVLWDGTLMNLGLSIIDYIILGCGVVLMFLVSLFGRSGSVREKMEKWNIILRYAVIIVLLLVVVLFGSYGIGFDASKFIYNQF